MYGKVNFAEKAGQQCWFCYFLYPLLYFVDNPQKCLVSSLLI